MTSAYCADLPNSFCGLDEKLLWQWPMSALRLANVQQRGHGTPVLALKRSNGRLLFGQFFDVLEVEATFSAGVGAMMAEVRMYSLQRRALSIGHFKVCPEVR